MRIKVFGDATGLVIREIHEWYGAGDGKDIFKVDVTFDPVHHHSEASWPVVFVVIYYELHSD